MVFLLFCQNVAFSINFTASKLNNIQPVHLLGIGDPIDIWTFVEQGIDTFDCVSPTRLARHGSALVKGKKGKINLKNRKYKEKLSPIDNLAKIKINVLNILKVIIYVYMKPFCLYIFNLIIAIFNNLYFINSFKSKKIIC